MAEEKVYYNDNRVTVSNLRTTIEGTTYPLDKITAVSVDSERPHRWRGAFLCFMALFIGFVFYINEASGLILLFPLSMFALGVYGEIRTVHYLKLERSSGKSEALKSSDAGYVMRIRDAINAALIGK